MVSLAYLAPIVRIAFWKANLQSRGFVCGLQACSEGVSSMGKCLIYENNPRPNRMMLREVEEPPW
jgi:hypothetical protein